MQSRLEPLQPQSTLNLNVVALVGVIKTYKLTYEPVDVLHALFDKNSATSHWTISSSSLKEFIEYFGPKTEQLDIYAEDERVTFTSFTEKITDGRGTQSHDDKYSVKMLINHQKFLSIPCEPLFQ